MKKDYTNLISLKRSNSIKLQVSTKIFPKDFFRRSSSLSPMKSNQRKRMINCTSLKKDLSLEESKRRRENGIYWGIMKDEIDSCLQRRERQKKLPLQRIWVLQKSEVKNKEEQKKRHEKDSEKADKRKAFLGKKYKKLTIPKEISQEKGVMEQGLFTFYGMIGKNSPNRHLCPLS